jgi:hypothetical protein
MMKHARYRFSQISLWVPFAIGVTLIFGDDCPHLGRGRAVLAAVDLGCQLDDAASLLQARLGIRIRESHRASRK